MSRRPDNSRSPQPTVDRPSFHIWQPLEAEGVQWEGQVAIVGGASDMPALLAVTSQRIALIANGQIMLDFSRSWLRPSPRLAAENGVRIFITPEGSTAEPQPVLLRARDGRGAAMELVSVLTGKPLAGRMPSRDDKAGITIPNWKETVGAARAVALPLIDDEPEVASTRSENRAWPPQESAVAAPKPVNRRREQVTTRPMQSLVDRRGGMVDPKPVPSSVSRAARAQGTEKDGVTIRDSDRWQEAHFTGTRQKRGGSSWLLTAAIMLVLLSGIGYVAGDYYGITADDLRERIPANIRETLGIEADEGNLAQAPETIDQPQQRGSDGTDGTNPDAGNDIPSGGDNQVGAASTEEPTPPSSDVNGEPLDPTLGLGGPTSELPETEEAEDDAGDPTVPVETVVVTEDPVEEPTAEPTVEPTVEPTAEPTVEPTIEPTKEPTAEPTVEATEEPEPTEAPTQEPTVEATEEPTVEATVEPTAEATEEADTTPEATVEPTTEPTEEPQVQAPSVMPETTPEQAVVADGFRYTIEGAAVGETIPELPQVNSVAGYGTWVVLDVYGQNMSSDVQVFDMSRFVLWADGEEVLLDSGTAWVNGLLGNTPAYGPTDAIQWAPGESHGFTLTFLAPANADSLVLQAGDQMIDISPAVTNPAPLMGETERIESDLIEGTVVEVVNGETIVVEIDGVRQTVRYLGIDVPTGDACYVEESTEANRALVEGQTVIIERQASDVDARGNWVRDVWVENEDGLPVLVSQQMVANGAAEARISEPNTRFAGWLQQSQADAEANGEGLWGACGE
jgi:endonuclease YncB( thermonuclease family)